MEEGAQKPTLVMMLMDHPWVRFPHTPVDHCPGSKNSLPCCPQNEPVWRGSHSPDTKMIFQNFFRTKILIYVCICPTDALSKWLLNWIPTLDNIIHCHLLQMYFSLPFPLSNPTNPSSFTSRFTSKNAPLASLVVQWLRIRLPMQGTWVWSLVPGDPTCHGATKPMCHNYWACALEPASHNYWACEPQLLSPHDTTTEAHTPRARTLQQEKPPQWEACSPQRRPNAAKNK